MKALLKFLVGCVVIAAIGMFSIHTGMLPGSMKSAQDRLLDKALIAIDDAKSDWAGVEIDGQKAILFGEAPSEEMLHKTETTLLGAEWRGGLALGGITIVDASQTTVFAGPPLADPFIWIAEFQADQLVLSGYAPSQNARDAIFQFAAMRFPDAELSGDVEIASGSPPEEAWLSAASISLQALARLNSGAAEANGRDFRVSGVASDNARAAAIGQLMQSIGGGLSGATSLTIAPPVVEAGPAPSAELAASALNAEPGGVCAETLQSVLGDTQISFATGSADINSASRQALDELATALAQCPQFSVAITGHTDSSGRAARNRQLSQSRADAVANYLRANSIDSARITTRGAGEGEPLTSNANPEGRARNRRIEFEVSPGNQE